jgi:RHS repeat-associated protein
MVFYSTMNPRRCQTEGDARVKDFVETRPDNTRIRIYVWGSDLSGSMQSAGGVGGLLEVSYYDSATTNCFPAFDGNGNVAALIHAADGMVAANDEYAAFGEPVRVAGVMAGNNPFRFPTKYADDESDLFYYDYRYYKPSLRRQVSVWHTNSCRRGEAISPNPFQQVPRGPFLTL